MGLPHDLATFDDAVELAWQPSLLGGAADDSAVPSGELVVLVVGDMLDALTVRYARPFSTGGLNLYRDGRDSVAWHGDRIPKEIVDPVVAVISLGHPRLFRLRPKGGGRSVPFALHGGDLLVTGGTAQRTWEHSVPKTASAGPRISVTFRH